MAIKCTIKKGKKLSKIKTSVHIESETTRKWKDNHTLEENVHIYVSDRGLVSGIHKELLQISKKKPNNLIFKSYKRLEQVFY